MVLESVGGWTLAAHTRTSSQLPQIFKEWREYAAKTPRWGIEWSIDNFNYIKSLLPWPRVRCMKSQDFGRPGHIWWTQRDAESRLSVMLLSLAKTTAWSHHRKHHCHKYRVCTCRLLKDKLKMRCSHKSCPAGMQPPWLNWAAAKNKLSTNEEMQARVRSIFFWSLSTWLHSGSFFPTRF